MERDAWYYFERYLGEDEEGKPCGAHHLWYQTERHGWIHFWFFSWRSSKKRRPGNMPYLGLFFRDGIGTWHEFRSDPGELLQGYRKIRINKEISDYYERDKFRGVG